jgi:membrane-bound ClpP family serine protease
MKLSKKNISVVFLVLGMAFLALGFSTNNKIFSWAAIACIVISLIAGGRWMRPRKR